MNLSSDTDDDLDNEDIEPGHFWEATDISSVQIKKIVISAKLWKKASSLARTFEKHTNNHPLNVFTWGKTVPILSSFFSEVIKCSLTKMLMRIYIVLNIIFFLFRCPCVHQNLSGLQHTCQISELFNRNTQLQQQGLSYSSVMFIYDKLTNGNNFFH